MSISGWRKVKLKNIGSRFAMGPFGSNIKSENFVENGVPVIRGSNLSNGRFNNKDFVYLTEEKADELKTSNAFPDDIVFTHRGTIGQVGIIPRNQAKRYVVSQSQMKMTCDANLADPQFVYYFFKSPIGQHELLCNTSTTGVPAIARPLASLKSVAINLPSILEQKAISATLSCLDDKIELNNRIDKNLEEMARAIFKSWFVDFEPFQDGEFEDSELGRIPKGWKVGSLGDIANITMGQSPSGSSYNETKEGTVFYQGRTDFGKRYPSIRLYTTEPKRMAMKGDILLSVRAPVGDINVASEDCCIGRGLASLKSRANCNSYLLYQLLNLENNFNVYNGEGTVFGSIDRKSVV
jgi:type I restriction enzyme S subunit